MVLYKLAYVTGNRDTKRTRETPDMSTRLLKANNLVKSSPKGTRPSRWLDTIRLRKISAIGIQTSSVYHSGFTTSVYHSLGKRASSPRKPS